MHFTKKYFHRGLIKAGLIALPITWLLLPDYFAAFQDYVLNDAVSYEPYEGIFFLMSLSSGFIALGLLGLWMAYLYEPRLDRKLSRFNVLCALLLGCGIFGILLWIVISFDMGMGAFEIRHDWYFYRNLIFPLIAMVYIYLLIRRVLHKRKPSEGVSLTIEDAKND